MKTGVAIVKVKSKTITTDEDFEKEKIQFYSQKLDEEKNSYFGSYVYKKRDTYDIRINQDLFQETKEYVLSRFN